METNKVLSNRDVIINIVFIKNGEGIARTGMAVKPIEFTSLASLLLGERCMFKETGLKEMSCKYLTCV